MRKNKRNGVAAKGRRTKAGSAAGREGRLRRIAGPVAVARGLDAKMYDVVLVGKERLLGEVIQISGDDTVIQVYEDTSGLRPGEPVESTGEQLTVELGPGLLTSIYDGIQRPLPQLARTMGHFIDRGARLPALDQRKRWKFVATAKDGMTVSGGQRIGYVEEVPGFKHFILVPPGVAGTLHGLKNGDYTVNDVIGAVGPTARLPTLPERSAARTDGNAKAQTKLYLKHRWPVRLPRPVGRRLAPERPLLTGQRVMDVLFPIAKGGTAIISGPFGSGKTVAQHQLAKWSDADIIVYVGCGERGNEMTEVLTEFPKLKDPRKDAPLMDRTVLIANTSNMPVAAREASIYTGVTIAEYFRDMGYDVAMMADSTSRWAEALREISSRLEEMPGEEGFPAYLASRLAAFYERAALVEPLGTKTAYGTDETQGLDDAQTTKTAVKATGSLSIIGAVSPPGGDFFEPVTQSSLRVAKAFWALDAKIAQRRHFPSVNWLEAYTLYGKTLAPWYRKNVADDWTALVERVTATLQEEARLLEIVQLVGADSLPAQQQVTLHIARLIREGLLQQQATDPLETYCPIQKSYLLMRLIVRYADACSRATDAGVTLHDIEERRVHEEIFNLKFSTSSVSDGSRVQQRIDGIAALGDAATGTKVTR